MASACQLATSCWDHEALLFALHNSNHLAAMKALLCTRYGTPDDLELGDVPDPEAGPDEVIMRVEAAALNFFDTLIIANKYQTKPPLPFSPAAECCGTVEALGAGVTEFSIGDRVMAYTGYGAARERIAVAADRLIRIPDSLDVDRAAGLCVTYGTTLHALKDRGKLKPSETLAVLGASGGTGLAAVELGKLMGARVIACASSAEKIAFARKHGADDVIDYGSSDLKESLRRVTEGRGADVIYDPVGGAYAEAALRSIAWQGRFLVVGFAAGEIPRLPLNLVLLKGCDVLGVFWGAWTKRDPAGSHANLAQIMDGCAQGKLSAHVHEVFPLERIAQALHALSDRKAMGKVILKP